MKTSLIAVLAAALCAAWTSSACAETDPITDQSGYDILTDIGEHPTAPEISSPNDAQDALGNLAQEATNGNGGNAPDTTAPNPGPTKDE